MTTITEQEPMAKATITTPGDRDVRIERIFNAPRDRVWQAMTDPKLVAQWWGRGNKLVIERLEVERGGHWRFVEHSDHGVHGFEGRFSEVTPPERMVLISAAAVGAFVTGPVAWTIFGPVLLVGALVTLFQRLAVAMGRLS